MLKKIVFLCVTPWEKFLPPVFQGHMKECYKWVCDEMILREENLYCKEKIENYGEIENAFEKRIFWEEEECFQVLYVESRKKEVIREVCSAADLVFVGLSGSRRECDRMFLAVLPWKEKMVFLWDAKIFDEKFLRQLQREYHIRDSQMLEIKKLPSCLTEA